MIIYANFPFYTSKYLAGKEAVIDTAFPYYARLATQEIKHYTGDNVNEYDIPEEVSMCCCELAEIIYRQEKLNNQADGVTSESVQGWSKSYENAESRKQTYNTAVKDCVYKWLSGTRLLYRGLR
ncbi:MAG: hypothetical protein ACI4RN_02025 [Oscillospiraceae bacterium]